MALEPTRTPGHSSVTGQGATGSQGAASSEHTVERQVLARVLEHLEINRSYSLVRFLTYICGKYFEGRQDEIREYSIAVDALGRKEGAFDSRIDPIVRVTARALRKKLAEYYENEGKDDPMRIVLPLGHYIPRFVAAHGPVGIQETSEPVEEQEEEPAAGLSGALKRILLRFGLLFVSRLGIAASALLLVALAFGGGYLLGHQRHSYVMTAGQAIEWGDPVWSDEFNGPAMQAPSGANWNYDVGGGGWGAKQQQIYCPPSGGPKECNPQQPNAFLDGSGHLVIRAQRNANGLWTSARMTTKGLHEFDYYRIEARMKFPVGKGLWPAFWMLGSNFSKVGWPESGSLDIVENVSADADSNGLGPTKVRATIHGPQYSGANGMWRDFHLTNNGRVDDSSYHTYGVIRSPGMIQFYVDDPANVYFTVTSNDIPEDGKWVFDHPFFLVMNLAIGGDWTGNPNADTPNPAEMLVDYVRVYKIPDLPAPSMQVPAIEVRSGSTAVTNVTITSQNYIGRVHLTCAVEPATASCSLASPVANFTDTLTQQDTLTITTGAFGSGGLTAAPPGNYKITIVAVTMSGNRTQIVVPYRIKENL